MTYKTITLQSGEVATLRLSAKKGSMAPLFWEEMQDALGRLKEARVLILRGQGNRKVSSIISPGNLCPKQP